MGSIAGGGFDSPSFLLEAGLVMRFSNNCQQLQHCILTKLVQFYCVTKLVLVEVN